MPRWKSPSTGPRSPAAARRGDRAPRHPAALARAQPGCTDAAAVGNPDRQHERFDAIELLAAAESPAAIGAAFAASPEVAAVVRSRTGRTTVLTGDGARVTLHAVAPGRFAAARRRLTGRTTWTARPPISSPSDTSAATSTRTPRRPTAEQHRGDGPRRDGARVRLPRDHRHTPAVNVLESGIGLDVGRLREHVAAIREVAGRLAGEGFTLLAGTEVDILPDGSLDYPDDVLAELDWVVASPHVAAPAERRARHGPDGGRRVAPAGRRDRPSDRPAPDPPPADGRRHGRHDRRVREHGTFLEINSNPERLDLSACNARAAREAGVRVVIDTDAHEVATLANIRYGSASPAAPGRRRPTSSIPARGPRSRFCETRPRRRATSSQNSSPSGRRPSSVRR